jgi:hypothetical protein
MDGPGPLRNKSEDVIKSGALGVTWISGAIGALTAIATVFNEQLVNIFGDDLADNLKAGILVAVILAWTLIAVADVMARAKVTAASLRVDVIPAPKGMKVKLVENDGLDDAWSVSAIRGGELLVAKRDHKPRWVKQSEVVLE